MDEATVKKKLIVKANELGIDKIGFASADPFVELKERLQKRISLNYHASFEETDIAKRTNPQIVFPKAKTLIAIALGYNSKAKGFPKSKPGAYRGIFSRVSWGTDYHIVLKDKMQQLKNFLLNLAPSAMVDIMVDTGPLSDRAVAERAGIGWSGKNTCTITQEYGSWVYLGHMITDLFLSPDEPIEQSCGDCNLCIEACPTGALLPGGGQLNSSLCISYITQTKDVLPDDQNHKLGNRLYGCDTCQIVCPKNKVITFANHPEFEAEPDNVKPLLKEMLLLSNKQFKRRIGHMSGSWRGKTPIQRNAILGLAHFKDKTAIPLLSKLLLEDSRIVIRATAAWALGQIGTEGAMVSLKKACDQESDPTVIGAIKKSLSLV